MPGEDQIFFMTELQLRQQRIIRPGRKGQNF